MRIGRDVNINFYARCLSFVSVESMIASTMVEVHQFIRIFKCINSLSVLIKVYQLIKAPVTGQGVLYVNAATKAQHSS